MLWNGANHSLSKEKKVVGPAFTAVNFSGREKGTGV